MMFCGLCFCFLQLFLVELGKLLFVELRKSCFSIRSLCHLGGMKPMQGRQALWRKTRRLSRRAGQDLDVGHGVNFPARGSPVARMAGIGVLRLLDVCGIKR